MTKTKREVLERLYEESWSNDDIPGGEYYEIEKKRFIDQALADIEALEPSKEEIYQCIVDYGKTTNYETRLFNYKDLAEVIHNLINNNG